MLPEIIKLTATKHGKIRAIKVIPVEPLETEICLQFFIYDGRYKVHEQVYIHESDIPKLITALQKLV